MTSEKQWNNYDDHPILYRFTGPFDEEHLEAFLKDHLDINDIAAVAITPAEKRDPDAQRPEVLATVSGISQEQNVQEMHSVYSEYELRELVKKFLNGNTLPQDASPAILRQITSQTLQTLHHKAERLVGGQPVEVVLRFSKPAGPRVGNPLVPFPAPPPSGNNLN